MYSRLQQPRVRRTKRFSSVSREASRFGSPRPLSLYVENQRRDAVRLIAVAPVFRRLRQPPKQPQERRRVPASNLVVRPPAAVPLLHRRRPDPRRPTLLPSPRPTRVHISSNEIVFTWGVSAFIPRIFLAEAGSPAPAGLRSERSSSIIRMDERAFFNPDERGRLVYLHRPAYRRHARALGVHGERPLDDFGRVAAAAAVGGAAILAVSATACPLASGPPVFGHPVGSAVGTSHVVSAGALPRHFKPFSARWIGRIIHNQRV